MEEIKKSLEGGKRFGQEVKGKCKRLAKHLVFNIFHKKNDGLKI